MLLNLLRKSPLFAIHIANQVTFKIDKCYDYLYLLLNFVYYFMILASHLYQLPIGWSRPVQIKHTIVAFFEPNSLCLEAWGMPRRIGTDFWAISERYFSYFKAVWPKNTSLNNIISKFYMFKFV